MEGGPEAQLLSPTSWRSEQTGGMLTPPSARSLWGRRPAATLAARPHSASTERGGRRASRLVRGAAASQRAPGCPTAGTAPTTPRPSVLEPTRDVDMETSSYMASPRGLPASSQQCGAQGAAFGFSSGGATVHAPGAAQDGCPAQRSAVGGSRSSAGQDGTQPDTRAGGAPAARQAQRDSATQAAQLLWARAEDAASTSASFLDEEDAYGDWMMV